MRRSFFLLLLSFYAALALGQGRHRLFRGLTQSKGLSNTDVKFVYQDRAGFMWLSSLDGLYRFDGNHARLFSPDTTQPHSMYGKMVQSPFFEDEAGDLWFTTETAINRYRAKTGDFDHYFVRRPNGRQIVDRHHYAFYRESSDGALWVVVSDSLYRFDTRHPKSAGASAWVCALPRAPRCTFHQMKQEMWVVVSFWEYGPGFELLRFDADGRLQRRDTYFAKMQGMKCYKSVIDNQHMIWLATEKGLMRFDPHQPEHWEIFDAPGPNPGVSSVCKYYGNYLALATSSSQLSLFDTDQKHFIKQQPMTDDEGLVRPILAKSVNYTPDGLLWCTEPGGGVYFGRLNTPVFHNLTERRKAININITQVYEHTTGQIWCPSYRDSTYLFGSDGLPYGCFFYPPYANFFRSAEGETLCCSSQGIQSLKNPRAATSSSPVTPVNNCVAAWKPGIALVGASQGLFAVRQGKTPPQQIPISKDGVTALFRDHYGRWWVGGSSTLGVWEIADDLSTTLVMQLPTRSMVNHIVADALQPDLIWAGTANGLWQIDSRKGGSHHLISVGSGGENFVQSVVPDRKGHIWLGTNQGLLRYDPDAAPAGRFKRYTRNNGLASNEYCRGAALLSSNGYIWIAGKKGLERFHPDSVQDLGTAPRLAIVGLHIYDQPWHCDSMCIEQAVQISLAHDDNTLRLELAALEYTDPDLNQYMVWLSKDEHTPDTVLLGTQHFITYANLSPGTYHFFYTACNAEGIWQNEPRRLDFIISPPFWDTWWFKLLVSLTLLSLAGIGTAFYYRYRLRAQQLESERQQREADRKQMLLENELALQQERNRIADEMHDELGGGLSTIRLSSERARKMDSPEELKNILSRVSQISISLISNMRGIIWAMDTQNDSLDSLLSYLRQFVRTFLDDNAIEAHIQIPMNFPDINLNSHYRHSIMLTVKECLNNIVKHAQGTQVWFHATAEEELVIYIRDNGQGFHPEEKVGSGKGLRTTVKRMESVGGSITWVRNPEGGMTTILHAPLG